MFALLFVIAGGFVTLTNLIYLMGRPAIAAKISESVAVLEARVDDAARQAPAPRRNVATQQAERLKHMLQNMAQDYARFLESRFMQVMAVFSGAVGLLTLVAAVGLWWLCEWARRLSIAQAVASICLQVFWLWQAPSQGWQPAGVQLLLDVLKDPAHHAQMQHMLQAVQLVGEWLGVICVLVWNGFVMWFFCRVSVKAQFQRMTAT